MVRKVEKVTGTIREGAAGAAELAHDVASEVAQKIEDALEEADSSGRKAAEKVKEELFRRWKTVDRAGRDNAFLIALGALAVGVLVGYLAGRDRN